MSKTLLRSVANRPAVAAALARGAIKLHGWVYKIETGEVFTFDHADGQFVPLAVKPPAPIPVPALKPPTAVI